MKPKANNQIPVTEEKLKKILAKYPTKDDVKKILKEYPTKNDVAEMIEKSEMRTDERARQYRDEILNRLDQTMEN